MQYLQISEMRHEEANGDLYFPGRNINEDSRLQLSAGVYLPHWELEGTTYHLCFRLSDSVPMEKLKVWNYEREQLQESIKQETGTLTEVDIKRLSYLYSEKIEQYLDNGYGSCMLRDSENARIVYDALQHYNEKRYKLHAWCIMPNHVHVMATIFADQRWRQISGTWKSFTAHKINRRCNRCGEFWQLDTYNHIVRNWDEYRHLLRYIDENPKKARLMGWPWHWRGDIS